MAQVSKISSFKSFTEVKNQEATMKLREENNAKRQETVGKIGAILDEMGLTSLSELDEVKKQALINKMFGNVSEDEAEDIEDEINKLGEPKKLDEGNAFIFAASKAKQEGKEEFEFNGKKYKVTLKKDTGLKEGNAFGDAVRKAKEDGEKEFEFEGETYKVEESIDPKQTEIKDIKYDIDLCKKSKSANLRNDFNNIIKLGEELVKKLNENVESIEGETYKVEESLNEGKHGMAKKLLKGIVDGNSSEAEGIKLSKDLADHYLYWINTSPYGKKNENLPLNMLIKASFNWGIERQLDPKLKKELEDLKASQAKNESVESIDEARSISKIQYDWSKVTTSMQATAQNWKAAEGAAKESLLGKLKEMTAQKKALEAELDAAIADKDKDLELVVTEAFFRLPKDVIGTELYVANQSMQSLYSGAVAGNDISPKEIDFIIKNLQQVKSLAKKFNKAEEVIGTVYEAVAKQFDVDFNNMVRNIKSGYGWIDPEYVADTWENSSDSIDFELVKGEIYKRLIAAKLLAYADDEDEESAGQFVKSLKELGIKESLVNEAEVKSDDEFKEYAMTVLKKAFGEDFDEAKAGEVVKGILGKVDGDYGAAVGMLTGSLGESLNEALKDITINDSEAQEIFDEIKRLTKLHKEKGFTPGVISVDYFNSASGAFGENPDDKRFKIAAIDATTFDIFVAITTQDNKVVCYVTMGYDTLKKSLKPGNIYLSFYNGRESKFNQKARQYKKHIYSGISVGESVITEREETQIGTHRYQGKSYPLYTDDEHNHYIKVNGRIIEVDESVTNEAFDANYWEDYHEDAGKIKNPSGMQLQQEVEASVEEWNDNNEDGKENEVTPAGEKKVLAIAKQFVKAKGWISSDVIDAMIAQES